ncbi:MAG TPA: DUF3034 family protein [Myxococcota bacterium]|nr:DUF3034 family protein [Myxococcota bacterium]
MRPVLALAAALLFAAAADAADPPAGAPAGNSARIEGWERWKAVFGSGRLLATGGVTQVEGAAGGGLVPWAVLAGYGTDQQVGGAAFYTRVQSDDVLLQSYGASLSFLQRLELSVARQRVDVDDPVNEDISQFIAGAKVRLLGDLVYTPWPTLAAGVQYKHNLDYDTPDALGAKSQDGVDFYLAASKLFLNGIYGFPVLLNTTVRATRANELGLLGFGGQGHNTYQPMFEGSAVVFMTRHIALGAEYRMKPDNLRGVDEDDWMDAFVAVFVNKHLALVGGYARLGDVALWNDQDSYYLNVQAGF